MDTTFVALLVKNVQLRDGQATASTLTVLPAQKAPAQRSTKLHGKSGHWKPNARHHYFKLIKGRNPIR